MTAPGILGSKPQAPSLKPRITLRDLRGLKLVGSTPEPRTRNPEPRLRERIIGMMSADHFVTAKYIAGTLGLSVRVVNQEVQLMCDAGLAQMWIGRGMRIYARLTLTGLAQLKQLHAKQVREEMASA